MDLEKRKLPEYDFSRTSIINLLRSEQAPQLPLDNWVNYLHEFCRQALHYSARIDALFAANKIGNLESQTPLIFKALDYLMIQI